MKRETRPESRHRFLPIGFAVGSTLIASVAALRAPDGFVSNLQGFVIFGGAALYFYDRLKGKGAWIGSIYTDKTSTEVGKLLNDLLAALICAVGLVYAFGFRW